MPPHEVQAEASAETAEGVLKEARIILNDLSPGGIGIYSPESMPPGTFVTISLQEPQAFEVSGKVVWCQDGQNGNRILSDQAYPFRVGVKFVFKSEDEEKAFASLCEDLKKNHLYKPKE